MGGLKKAAELLDKKPQKINVWMLKWMPDFYKSKCFKIKNGRT
jgi:hypothetical protein